MGKSKDLATGETRFVNTAGDTMTGNLAINNASGSQVTLHRSDTTIANDDLVGQIIMSGDDADSNSSGTRGYIRGRSQGTGGGLKMEFGTAGGGVAIGDPRMTINADGIVTMPNQPYAYASSQSKATATNKIQLDFGHYSGGGLTIDQTNERMTVPVAGLYAIGFTQLTDVAAYVECYIKINGTVISGSRAQTGNTHQYGMFGTKIIIQLQANDYAEIWCGAGTTHNNVGYNIHYVYLLG
jgi:hypothetical protein